MVMAELDLKSIHELEGKSFVVPDYQQGYRWRKDEVQQPLKDLYEYANSGEKSEAFYCLQPVVVLERERERMISGDWTVSSGSPLFLSFASG